MWLTGRLHRRRSSRTKGKDEAMGGMMNPVSRHAALRPAGRSARRPRRKVFPAVESWRRPRSTSCPYAPVHALIIEVVD